MVIKRLPGMVEISEHFSRLSVKNVVDDKFIKALIEFPDNVKILDFRHSLRANELDLYRRQIPESIRSVEILTEDRKNDTISR